MAAPLPITLGDLGDHWRLFFHCLTCGHHIGPAFYYLKRKWGDDARLVDLLPRLKCLRCSPQKRTHECAMVIEPEAYHAAGGPGFRGQRYQLRRGGGDWQPFNGD